MLVALYVTGISKGMKGSIPDRAVPGVCALKTLCLFIYIALTHLRHHIIVSPTLQKNLLSDVKNLDTIKVLTG